MAPTRRASQHSLHSSEPSFSGFPIAEAAHPRIHRCAEGGTADQHSEVVFRSRAVFGPYEPGPVNPILTQRHLDPSRPFPITSTGHADFVQTQNGEWWAVFLGTRPYEDDTYNIGRETFLLPVLWRDGWPIMLSGTETVPYVARAPDLPADTLPGSPMSGNFTVRDDFDGLDLGPAWTFIRTVREPWYDVTSTPGWLTIQARPAALEGLGQPSFVGRRQQHLRATASTAMRYRPLASGDEAGIAAFQSSDYYYLLGVTLVDGRPVIQLKERAGPLTQGMSVVIASSPLEASPDSTLYLRIRARGGSYDFSYAYRPEEWILLKGDVDGTILSTRVARGFVGTMLGMYAHRDWP